MFVHVFASFVPSCSVALCLSFQNVNILFVNILLSETFGCKTQMKYAIEGWRAIFRLVEGILISSFGESFEKIA